jgi:lysophospholipase L1-like esterase
MRLSLRILVCLLVVAVACLAQTFNASAQTLNVSDYRIEWKVVNRFRLFRDEKDFRLHENAWRQYRIHVDNQPLSESEKKALIARSSVHGIERVLNDRFIAFTRTLRQNFDWRGWASRQLDGLCWNSETRRHDACGGSAAYVVPQSHEIEARLVPLKQDSLVAEFNCVWSIDGRAAQTAPCDASVLLSLPWPSGGNISVAVEGENPISLFAKVKDMLIVGLGDSFGSGEGNPDVPVTMSGTLRYRNLYPQRAVNDVTGNAQWLDRLCHRSLYSHQLRAALQIAIENPRASVTFLGYACSGATIEAGILGPQEYVERVATGQGSRFVAGSSKDSQLRWLLRELCAVDAEQNDDGQWICPGGKFRRSIDYLLLSVGGNDIGFSSIVAWATLRQGTSARLAKFFGATVGPQQFASNMADVLPDAYTRLGRVLENTLPLHTGEPVFDPSRIVLTSYPDMLVDETGAVCPAGSSEDEEEDRYAANQSLDGFSSWLATTTQRLNAVHDQLEGLHARMKAHAGDLGWTFARRVYEDRFFTTHGFCARNSKFAEDPAEMLMLPCWGKADRPTQTCQSSWSGKAREWRPYNPAVQHYPYALRQRWVRSFNDAYMTINEKVMTKSGRVDDRSSSQAFTETTGAMHPNAEGQAAMADAILLDLRANIAEQLAGELR